ncbi:MAG: DUF5652 family protein [Candidatus Gracilibacteria bacterium]
MNFEAIQNFIMNNETNVIIQFLLDPWSFAQQSWFWWALVGLILLILWCIIWKGFALWYSARNNQKAWFIVLLGVNTLGILEILYLVFWRANKKKSLWKKLTSLKK